MLKMYYQKKAFLLEYSMKEKPVKFLKVFTYLDDIISHRNENYNEKSYISKLLRSSVSRVSQKVGEEAVEVVIAANKNSKQNLINESADLIFHLLILWKKKKVTLSEIAKELESRKNDR